LAASATGDTNKQKEGNRTMMATIWWWLCSPAFAQTTTAAPAGDSANWIALIQTIPGIGPLLPYIPIAITVCAALATALPGPTVKHGVYYYLYQIINTIALNAGHAKNLNAPESTGIVGGASGTSAPLIATDVVPLVMATPAQKVVTTMPSIVAPPGTVAPPAAVVAGQQAAADFAAKKAMAPPA
jgi:hypothetical protein